MVYFCFIIAKHLAGSQPSTSYNPDISYFSDRSENLEATIPATAFEIERISSDTSYESVNNENFDDES